MGARRFKDYWEYFIISSGTPRHWFPFLRGKILKKYAALRPMNRNANQFAKEHKLAEEDLRGDRQFLRDLFSQTTLEEYWKYYVLSNDAPHYHLPWRGREMTKFPADVVIYEDLIYSARPDVLIEIGTQRGVSALFFASLLKSYDGSVITIDIKSPAEDMLREFQKEGIHFIHGDATSIDTAMRVKELVAGRKCFIVDDGSHKREDVLSAFKQYQECIAPGGYFVIEDGLTNWLAGNRDFDALGAVDEILRTNAMSWKRCKRYDPFVFFSMYQGILQKTQEV